MLVDPLLVVYLPQNNVRDGDMAHSQYTEEEVYDGGTTSLTGDLKHFTGFRKIIHHPIS